MAIKYNDVGTIFTLTIVDDDGDAVDVSGGTSINIVFLRPDETSVTKTAVFVTDGSDGQIKYTTVDQDLIQAGRWHIQGYVNIGDTTIFHSEIDTFVVGCNLDG